MQFIVRSLLLTLAVVTPFSIKGLPDAVALSTPADSPPATPIREITSDRILVCAGRDRARPLTTGIFFGDEVRTPARMREAIEGYRARYGALPGMVKIFHSLEDDFTARGEAGKLLRAIADYPEVTPLVSLEPTWYGSPERDLLGLLAEGGADRRLRRFARGVAMVEGEVLVEFAAEMNARFQASWQAEHNGDTEGPRVFQAAWRRAVDVARNEGAENVRWVFAPSAGNPYTHHPTGPSHWNWYGHWFPGDDYVDYLGIHLFNHAREQGAWVPFVELVSGDAADRILDDMTARFPQFDVIIGEFASSEHPERADAKAEWITDAYDRLAKCPNVAAAVWFDMDKEADWHIDSSPSSASAYGIAVHVDPGTRARLARVIE